MLIPVFWSIKISTIIIILADISISNVLLDLDISQPSLSSGRWLHLCGATCYKTRRYFCILSLVTPSTRPDSRSWPPPHRAVRGAFFFKYREALQWIRPSWPRETAPASRAFRENLISRQFLVWLHLHPATAGVWVCSAQSAALAGDGWWPDSS